MHLDKVKPLYKVDLSSHPVVEIRGPEHKEWLNRISSQYVSQDKEVVAFPNAFLKAEGGAIAYFMQLALEERSYLFLNPWNVEAVMAYLEFSHFGEDLTFSLIKDYQRFFVASAEPLQSLFVENESYAFAWPNINAYEVFSLGENNIDLPVKTWSELRMYLFQQGIPVSGLDLTEKHMILEGPFNDFVTDAKGCYPGQETIAKVYTYGRIAKSFYPIRLKTEAKDSAIFFEDQKCGDVVSQFKYEDGLYAWLRLSTAFVKKNKAGKGNFYLENEVLDLDF